MDLHDDNASPHKRRQRTALTDLAWLLGELGVWVQGCTMSILTHMWTTA
ncbi:MAG: hypothetical protein R3268_13165 [Acidiferrobacterales bacterium]|nr:hypothetical protein [Acidiferrobacterales bacterium]